MKLDPKIKEHFDVLIKFGKTVMTTRRESYRGLPAYVDSASAEQWYVSTASFVRLVMGEDSEHYRAIKVNHGTISRASSAEKVLSSLLAARDDYELGMLSTLRLAVAADVFDDFLEQADHMLSLGYHQVAMVIAGCVLEDGLRKLCEKHTLPISEKPKLDSMNADLAKAGVYTKLIQKKITWLADMRNKAAHGRWDDLTQADGLEMVSSVRRFMEEHFA